MAHISVGGSSLNVKLVAKEICGVATSQKTDPFKYGAKIYIGVMVTAIHPVEAVLPYTGRSIDHPDLHPNAMLLAVQLFSMLPQVSTSCVYFIGYKCI